MSSSESSGIGLAIVRSIVEAHGWSIRVIEATSDGFSTFAVGVNSVAGSDAANTSSTETNASSDTSSDTSSDEALGFGVVVTVLAMLTLGLAARRDSSG